MRLPIHSSVLLVIFAFAQYTATAQAQTAEVALEAFNEPGCFLRHRNGETFIDPILTDRDARSCRFRVKLGLANPTLVSFESVDRPGHYLRHRNWRLLVTECATDL